MSRKPPRPTEMRNHYMGEHVLFHNGSTAKRFPMLDKVPQEELAHMFSVPLVDKQAVKNEERANTDEYKEGVFSFRPSSKSSSDSRPPFIPSNPSHAKANIATPPGTVFFMSDDIHANDGVVKRQRIEEAKMGTGPSFHFGSTREAQERIQSNFYMYSMDEETAKISADRMQRRRAQNVLLLKNSSTTGSNGGGSVRRRAQSSSSQQRY